MTEGFKVKIGFSAELMINIFEFNMSNIFEFIMSNIIEFTMSNIFEFIKKSCLFWINLQFSPDGSNGKAEIIDVKAKIKFRFHDTLLESYTKLTFTNITFPHDVSWNSVKNSNLKKINKIYIFVPIYRFYDMIHDKYMT